MGQKVSPHGFRVGVIKDWDSKWYADKNNFADYLVEDDKIRKYLKKKLYNAGIADIVIERQAENAVRVIIAAGRPGMIIGRDGSDIEILKKELMKMTGKEVKLDVKEVGRTELSAQLTAESIAEALEKRVSFRRAMKQSIGRTMKAGAKGVKVLCSGRLGGAEIARSEKYSEGNVPLHTLRADIDYGFAEADTTYGKIGVKVWINHGEILDKGLQSPIPEEEKGRKGGRRQRRDRRGRRDGYKGRGRGNDRRRVPKAVNPRVRNTPKVDPEQEAAAKAAEAASEEAEAASNEAAEAEAAETAAPEAPAAEEAPKEEVKAEEEKTEA
jgi:small subunit ribosomal protein S3